MTCKSLLSLASETAFSGSFERAYVLGNSKHHGFLFIPKAVLNNSKQIRTCTPIRKCQKSIAETLTVRKRDAGAFSSEKADRI